MRRLAAVLALCAAPAVAQQQICLTDHQAFMDGNPQGFDAAMQSVLLAHLPIELRNSCGLIEDVDLAYYTALADTLACSNSETYHQVFAQILKPQTAFIYAATPEDFVTPSLFDDYCAQVAQIDMPGFIAEDGTLSDAHLQAQLPLMQTILTFVAQFRGR